MCSIPSRKGLTRSMVMLIIFLLISFAIISLGIYFFFENADEPVSEATCRASMEARARFVMRSETFNAEIPSPVPVMCKTFSKEITAETKEGAMKQIADLSAKCWWMFLEGQYRNQFNTINPVFSYSPCFICYTFMIIPKSYTITGDELKDYMYSTYYIQPIESTKKEDNQKETTTEETKGVTYLEYIQSYRGQGKLKIGNKDENLEMRGSKEIYAISFMSPDTSTAEMFPVEWEWWGDDMSGIVITKLSDISETGKTKVCGTVVESK